MTILLLDTHSLFFRAHHALPPMNTTSGEATAALYGFSSLFLKLLREQRPEAIAFARDLPSPTFRHRAYADYKAGRPPMPDALRTQWRRLEELLEATGLPTHGVAGFEADDVLATLTSRLTRDQDRTIVLVSGDRDLFQLIGPKVRVLYVGARAKKPEWMDERAVLDRYQVLPSRLPMLSALVGEAADNLLGVPGVGVRTASKLVLRWETMQDLVENLDAVTPPKLRESLESAKERILMNDDLARLRGDLELTDGPLVGPLTADGRARLRALFEVLEFKSLVPRLDALGMR